MIEIANTIVNPRYKNYDIHYFPHDGNVHEYSTGATRVETARQHMRGKVEAVKMNWVSEGINNVRNMFPNCYFDEAKCSKGLWQLAKYRRKYDERNGMFLDRPEHKDSHGPDWFRYLANVYADLTKQKAQAISYEADYSEFY